MLDERFTERRCGTLNTLRRAFSIRLLTKAETHPLSNLPQFVEMVDAIVLPLIGLISLFWSKVSQGEVARLAEKQFLLSLIVITIVTLRTVVNCDDVWLVHTLTLSVMIVGALAIPNRDTSVAL